MSTVYLLMVGEVVHGSECEVDHVTQTAGVDLVAYGPLGQVVQTRCGRHLNPQLLRVVPHAWQYQLSSRERLYLN